MVLRVPDSWVWSHYNKETAINKCMIEKQGNWLQYWKLGFLQGSYYRYSNNLYHAKKLLQVWISLFYFDKTITSLEHFKQKTIKNQK